MIYDIVAFGHPSLRKETKELKADFPDLEKYIADLYETMYNAQGVGLASPQIGKSIRLFIVDGSPMEGTYDEFPEPMEGWKKVFINPEMIEETGDEWPFEEGCLSIPDIREDVYRPSKIRIRYQDENFDTHEEDFDGLKARIIQHEYDHLEGILFTDYVKGLRKMRLKSRLLKISRGKHKAPYPMNYPNKKD